MENGRDIFQVLHADHSNVSDLIDQLITTQSPDKKRKLFSEIREELESHSSAEELAVYSKLRKVEMTVDLAVEAEHEHSEIRRCLDRLEDIDYEDENWDEGVKQLCESVGRHVQEEENEIFESMRAYFDESQLDEMKASFLAAKKDLTFGVAA